MNAGPVDCCPRCLVAAIPYRTEPDPGGMRAYYRCPEGHRWHRNWELSDEQMDGYGYARSAA